MRITVIGARGFIGRRVVAKLNQYGIEGYAPERDDKSIFEKELGKIIYCAGLTADFRQRPFDTVRAHVSFLAELLEKANYESMLYLSSTRVYLASSNGAVDNELVVNPIDKDCIFNISKLMGEALCLSQPNPEVRIARISNVYGDDYESDNFLFSLIRDAINKKEIVLRSALTSEKDYIDVDLVAEVIIQIAISGKERIYNVASGFNTTNKEVVTCIKKLTGCSVRVLDGAPEIIFPTIDIQKTIRDFSFSNSNLLDNLPKLVADYNTR